MGGRGGSPGVGAARRGWVGGTARRVLLIALTLLAMACGTGEDPDAVASVTPPPTASPSPTPRRVVEGRIQSGDNLTSVLIAQGVGPTEARAAIEALRTAGLDVRRIQLDRPWLLELDSQGRLLHFEYDQSQTERFHLDVSPTGAFLGVKEAARIESRQVALRAEISSNLSMAIKNAGEGSGLTQALVDVFQWDLNFYSDTRAGDTIDVLFEREYVDGAPSGRYGKIIAARYHGKFVGEREIFQFEGQYFDRKGREARKNFLTAPLDVLRVTSAFGQRFHPIHKVWKQHTGVDYGAPKGTPVWAVSDGVVTAARRGGTGYGNHVRIRHAGGYETLYAHLSRINVVTGQRVKQKMRIGEVGMTGAATAPHLHFEISIGGKRVNPAKQRMIPGKPMDPSKRGAFEAEMARLVAELEAHLAQVELVAEAPAPPPGWTLPVGDGRR